MVLSDSLFLLAPRRPGVFIPFREFLNELLGGYLVRFLIVENLPNRREQESTDFILFGRLPGECKRCRPGFTTEATQLRNGNERLPIIPSVIVQLLGCFGARCFQGVTVIAGPSKALPPEVAAFFQEL